VTLWTPVNMMRAIARGAAAKKGAAAPGAVPGAAATPATRSEVPSPVRVRVPSVKSVPLIVKPPPATEVDDSSTPAGE
jgi:hypothetical protein